MHICEDVSDLLQHLVELVQYYGFIAVYREKGSPLTFYLPSVQVVVSSNVYYIGVMMGHKNAFAETI